MNDMTAANMRSAYSGESMAHMRYKIWAEMAERENFPNVGRLLRAISRAEQAHATNHFRTLRKLPEPADIFSGAPFGLDGTSQNLVGAIEGETFEIEQMYPAYLAVAEMQGEQEAVRSINYALSAEKIHAKMFTDAKKSVDDGKDIELGPVQICTVCGHTLEGDAPDVCPICKNPKEKYVSFE